MFVLNSKTCNILFFSQWSPRTKTCVPALPRSSPTPSSGPTPCPSLGPSSTKSSKRPKPDCDNSSLSFLLKKNLSAGCKGSPLNKVHQAPTPRRYQDTAQQLANSPSPRGCLLDEAPRSPYPVFYKGPLTRRSQCILKVPVGSEQRTLVSLMSVIQILPVYLFKKKLVISLQFTSQIFKIFVEIYFCLPNYPSPP